MENKITERQEVLKQIEADS